MAVVSKKAKSAPQETAAEAPKVEATEPTGKTIKLELRLLKRYFFQNTLYEAGRVYEFEETDARAMLQHTVDTLPVFTFAKPRVKYVEVPVEDGVVKIKKPRVERKSMTLEQFAAEAQGKEIEPVSTIDLSDDDPEIKAKLEAADSDEGEEGTEV